MRFVGNIIANTPGQSVVGPFNTMRRGFSQTNLPKAEDMDESLASILQQTSPSMEEDEVKLLDAAFRQQWRQIDSVEKLRQFYQFNKETFGNQGVGQQLLVLKKINKLWLEEVGRGEKDSSQLQVLKAQASAIQLQIVTNCLKSRATLDAASANTLLVELASSDLDRSMITPQMLADFEQHISELPEFLTSSSASTLAAFIGLGHIPSKLIDGVMSTGQISSLQADGAYILLRQLVSSQIVSMPQLYKALWERVQTGHTKVPNRRCASIINLLTEYQKLFPGEQNNSIKTMQLFVDRYQATFSMAASQQSGPNEVLWAMNNVRKFKESTSNNLSDQPLEAATFFEKCSSLVMSRASKMQPEQLLSLIESFSDHSKQKHELVRSILKTMRRDEYDVRAFNFAQLAQFVNLVAEADPHYLHVFKKYVDTALIQNYFKDQDLQLNFASLFDMMHTFALNRELTDGAATYKFLLLLKGKIKGDDLNGTVHQHLISIIWSLIVRESVVQNQLVQTGKASSSFRMNPIIPRLLSFLHDYKRDAQLNKLEYLQLYQINIWIDNQVEDGRLPEEFIQCIPTHIKHNAAERYQEYDKPYYHEIQTDIAKHLLKLRVTFRQNERIDKQYRCDIKLLDKNLLIMVHSEDEKQIQARQQGAILGLEKLKQDWLSSQATDLYHVEHISVEKWTNLNQVAKLQLLGQITNSQSAQKQTY